MHNILILFNPYYQKDVIDEHLKVLCEQGKVAFGKVRSKHKNMVNPAQDELSEIYKSASESAPIQLFLSDYASLFVAKVVAVSEQTESKIIPEYYAQKSLEVEHYFIITDMRELVLNDFVRVRDEFLGEFCVPHFGGHSYAIYGNSYVYPLIIEPKKPHFYFDNAERYFINIYKSKSYLELQEIFKNYIFGPYFSALHPDSLSHLINAELEFIANRTDPLYDFTSVLVKLSKVLECELHEFVKHLVQKALLRNESLNFSFCMQGNQYELRRVFAFRPNIGSMLFIMQNRNLGDYLDQRDINLIRYLKNDIYTIKGIRNEGIHQSKVSLADATLYRDKMLGIKSPSVLKTILAHKVSHQI